MTFTLGFDHKSATLLWQKGQEAVRLADALNDTQDFSAFADEAVVDWIELQDQDLITSSKPIRKLQDLHSAVEAEVLKARFSKSDDLIENLTERTKRLVVLKNDLLEVKELKAKLSDRQQSGQAAFNRHQSDDAKSKLDAEFESLLASLDEMAQDLMTRVERLAGFFETANAPRILQAAEAGRRPIRDALDAEAEGLREFISSLKPQVREQEPPTSHPSTAQRDGAIQQDGPQIEGRGDNAPNPQIQLRRKELGGALSAGEVYRRTEVYFKSLWDAEIEQRHCGAILIFEPTASRGISIHDLLGLSNTDAMLEQAKTQILARFGRRD